MAEIARIHDISPVVSAGTAVFPGDVSFSRMVSLDFNRGDALTLSSVTTTLHVGAHADAPSHYHPKGLAIDDRALSFYLGPCQVVSVKAAPSERLTPRHLDGARITEKRVLLKTGSFPDPDRWNGDFNSLSPELVDWLKGRGVLLVGIDTPSIDPANDEKLESHEAVFRNDMAILEGLVLDQVPEGHYMLAALPLRIQGADASPVRAVLWKS